MTARERRIAELAAQDLEGWARELPLGSETRRDLQQTARVYRFAARAGATAAALRAVPDAGVEEVPVESLGEATSPTRRQQAPDGAALVDVPRTLGPPLDRGA